MRIAPHTVWVAARGQEGELLSRIVQDAAITHGHPRAILGAIVMGAALHAAIVSKESVRPLTLIDAAQAAIVSYDEIHESLPWGSAEPAGFKELWSETQSEMSMLLDVAASSVERGSMSNVTDTISALGANGVFAGSGTNSVAAALYLASRAGTRPMSGLLQAAYEPDIDTDTVASMCATLLGAVHGNAWLGELDVQDATYIERVSEALTRDARAVPIDPALPTPGSTFTRALDDGAKRGAFPDGREYRALGSDTLSERPWVVRHHLLLSDGQTVFVDRLRRDVRPQIAHAPLSPALPVAQLRVTLPTRNIRLTASFYETLLGGTLPVNDGGLELTEQVAFVEVPDAVASTVGAQITLEGIDVARVRSTLPVRDRPDGGVSVKDPDGRVVFLTPFGTAAGAPTDQGIVLEQ